MERQQLNNKKANHPSSTNVAAVGAGEEPARMKFMNLQNIQVRRMPSNETRLGMQTTTTADRVKAANTQLSLGAPTSQILGGAGGGLAKNPEEHKKLQTYMATLETNGNSNPYGAQGKKTQMAGMTSRNLVGMHGDS